MQELGIRDTTWKLTEPMTDVKPWSELEEVEKIEFDRRMAVYAAQIDIMDQGIGRVINTLEEKGMLDNTVILLLSDNGGTAEFISRGNIELNLIGTDESYESYRKPWATMSNTPFRLFKQWVHEGGISSPFIVHWPEGMEEKGGFRHQVGHVIDLMPTCMELAGAEYPEVYKGHHIIPFEGQSLVPSFHSNKSEDRILYWEHQANRAIRMGEWKLVASKTYNVEPYTGPWELYHLNTDRSETNDLSTEYPQKVNELDSLWNAWAIRCNVYPLDGRGWYERLDNPN